MNDRLHGKGETVKSPLDKIIAEQAAYYGMSVEDFTKHSEELAILQEQCEFDN